MYYREYYTNRHDSHVQGFCLTTSVQTTAIALQVYDVNLFVLNLQNNFILL